MTFWQNNDYNCDLQALVQIIPANLKSFEILIPFFFKCDKDVLNTIIVNKVANRIRISVIVYHDLHFFTILVMKGT